MVVTTNRAPTLEDTAPMVETRPAPVTMVVMASKLLATVDNSSMRLATVDNSSQRLATVDNSSQRLATENRRLATDNRRLATVDNSSSPRGMVATVRNLSTVATAITSMATMAAMEATLHMVVNTVARLPKTSTVRMVAAVTVRDTLTDRATATSWEPTQASTNLLLPTTRDPNSQVTAPRIATTTRTALVLTATHTRATRDLESSTCRRNLTTAMAVPDTTRFSVRESSLVSTVTQMVLLTRSPISTRRLLLALMTRLTKKLLRSPRTVVMVLPISTGATTTTSTWIT